MKSQIYLRIFILILSIVYINSFQVSCTTYYVSPDGNDNNPGLKNLPWGSFSKAFKSVKAGDSVFFRDGVYYTAVTQQINSLHGTKSDPICFLNYPGENPIIDGINRTTPSGGVLFHACSNIILKGITVRNIKQINYNYEYSIGFAFTQCNNITIENCTTHDIGYRGFYSFASDTLYFLNCDAYNVVDSLSSAPGNAGDGFIIIPHTPRIISDSLSYTIFKGCRAWHCSDDGWDVETEGYLEIFNCWGFKNGYEKLQYGGNGFKLQLTPTFRKSGLSRKIWNCMAAYNKGSGFTTNDNDDLAKSMLIHNNTSYANGLYGKQGYGFVVFNTSSSDQMENERTFINNLSYNNLTYNIFATSSSQYTHHHNTWDIPVNVTDSDFASLDSTGLTGARDDNHELPFLNFLRLKEGSGNIDVGYKLGHAFSDNGPDLGAFEFISEKSILPPEVTDIPNQRVIEGHPFKVIDLNLLVSDLDDNPSDIKWSFSKSQNLNIKIVENKAYIEPKDPEWNGIESVIFTASDKDGSYDTDEAVFSITRVNDAPVLTQIPKQVVKKGENFEPVNLNDYVNDPDNPVSQLIWQIVGQKMLSIDLDSLKLVQINSIDPDWSGSETLKFIVTDPEGLSDTVNVTYIYNPEEISVKIYPNPCSGHLFVSIKGNGESPFSKIYVYDLSGKSLYVKDFVQDTQDYIIELELSSLPDALYIIQVQNDYFKHSEIIRISD